MKPAELAIKQAWGAFLVSAFVCILTVIVAILTGSPTWGLSPHAPKPFALGEGTFSLVFLGILGFSSAGQVVFSLAVIDLIIITGLGYAGFRRKSRLFATILFGWYCLDHLLFLALDFQWWSSIARTYWVILVVVFGVFFFRGTRASYRYRLNSRAEASQTEAGGQPGTRSSQTEENS